VDYDRIDASRVDPKDHIEAWAKIEAGLLARNGGDFEKTVVILERLLASYPTINPVILRDYAEACRQTGRLDRAIEIYEKLLKTAGPDANDSFGLGVVWHLKGDDARAGENLERAVALDPANKTAWLDLGSARLSLQRFDAAREAFAKAAALDPRSADALSGLASVAFSTKDYGQAEGLLQTALTVEPVNEELRLHLALVKRAMGDSAAARAIYTTLTKSRKPDVANRAAQELRQLR
jgi:Flp pilus assembly protein TadD